MDKKAVISIIIPVYNAEKYIGHCIESLLSQTYKNIEIVLIDDGSQDNSFNICKSYSDLDKRVHVYSQENEGAATARNIGIKYATGKYIQFIDSDDYVDTEYCEKLLASMEDGKYQLGICSYYFVKYDGIRKCTIKHNKKYSFFSYLLELISSPMTYYHGVLWNKIYLKDIIDKNNIKFIRSISLGEDFVFNLEYLKHVKRVRAIDECLYYYVCYLPESLSKKEKNIFDRVIDRAVLFDYYKEFFEYKGLYSLMKPLVNAYIISFYVTEIQRTSELDIQMNYTEMELYRDYIYERCIEKYNIGKFSFLLFRIRRLIVGNLYMCINNGVTIVLYEKLYTLLKKLYKLKHKQRNVLLYCNSEKDELYIMNYYNVVKECEGIKWYLHCGYKINDNLKDFCKLNNIKILNKVNFKVLDLVVCSDRYIPGKLSLRIVPIIYINHGNNDINDKNGFKSYPYKYYLDKSMNSNVEFSYILEPNKRYAKVINNRFDEFFCKSKYVGYSLSDKIYKIQKENKLQEKNILILLTGYKNGLLRIYSDVLMKSENLIKKGYKISTYVNEYEYEDIKQIEKYFDDAKTIGINVIKDFNEYLIVLAESEVVICDYTSLLEDVLLMRKKIVLVTNNNEDVWDFSIFMKLKKKAIIYKENEDMEYLIKSAKENDLDEVYDRCKEEISVSYGEYKKNVLSLIDKILNNKHIKEKELYRRQRKYMDAILINDRDEILEVLKQYDRVFTPSITEMVKDIEAYADKLAEKSYFFIAKKKEEVVGMMVAYKGENEKEGEAYITLLGIMPKYQKKLANGIIIGKLFRRSQEEAIKNNIKTIKVEVRDDNEHAIKLYKKVGLKVDSRASDHSVYMTMQFEDFMI